jgi:superfamily II DNA or RNA helicase
MKTLRSYDWALSYSTSELRSDGSEVNILEDFYLPVLSRAVSYDRVAGYFRSSSLAAASQGFSAFVGGGGRARFVVGADLEAADVEAILQGDKERLANSLITVLAETEAWPVEVSRGVQLLAWMVAQDYLEIRVALRVHRRSGKPLAFDSRADGYVHEKWALFSDSQDWLYAAGSLNESKTALVLNAENLDVHCSWESSASAQRVAKKRQVFEQLWRNENPSLPVYTLPEAVRQRLLSISEQSCSFMEIDGASRLTPKSTHLPPPSDLEWLQFAIIRHAPYLPNGHYVGMATAPVEPWPHQSVVARRIIDRWPSNLMLCDEVGLGKTIETGLAVRSLTLSGLAQSVLIAAPASLTAQWLRELADKFYLPFQRWVSLRKTFEQIDLLSGEPVETPSEEPFGPKLQIISTGLFQRQAKKLYQAMPNFDLILVDEAHKARRKNPHQPDKPAQWGKLFTAIERGFYPKAQAFLLATATPMQVNPIEALDLLRVMPHAGPAFRAPDLANAYYESLQMLKNGAPPAGYQSDYLRRHLLSVQQLDQEAWQRLLETVVPRADRSPFLRWVEGRSGRAPHNRLLQRCLPVFFAVAPLSRVMLRHGRSLLEVYRARGQLQANLARRQVDLKAIAFSGQERVVYELLESYCRQLAEQIGQQLSSSQRRGAIGFYLSFLRLRFASSLYALRETLLRRHERVEMTLAQWRQMSENNANDVYGQMENGLDWEEFDPDNEFWTTFALKGREPNDLKWELNRVEELLGQLDDLSPLPSKTRQLLEIIGDRLNATRTHVKSLVVFTRYADTLDDLARWLRQRLPSVPLGTFSGAGGRIYGSADLQPRQVDRQRIKHAFIQGQIDILLCTDAAAEGLNLQTADLLINFDLPWNPMLVEQRIGRIDRIGQRHDHIQVINLCYRGSVEETVYGRLLARLAQADLVVGSQQVALLPVSEEEFEALAEGLLSEEELYDRAQERCQQTQAQSVRTELEPQRLYDIYQRESQRLTRLDLPVRLASIWEVLVNSAHLRGLGCQVEPFADGEALVLNHVPGIADNTLLTVSRGLLEKGLPESDERVLRFASYGDPIFEHLINYMLSYPQPLSVAPIADAAGTVRSFVVQMAEGDAVTVAGLDATQGLKLATETAPAATAVDAARAEVSRVIAKNQQARAGMANSKAMLKTCADFHQLLVLAVAYQLLLEKTQPQDSVRVALQNLTACLEENQTHPLHLALSAPAAASLGSGAVAELFEVRPTATGSVVVADPILLQGAINTCKREAAALKKSGQELTAAHLCGRLKRLMGNAR